MSNSKFRRSHVSIQFRSAHSRNIGEKKRQTIFSPGAAMKESSVSRKIKGTKKPSNNQERKTILRITFNHVNYKKLINLIR